MNLIKLIIALLFVNSICQSPAAQETWVRCQYLDLYLPHVNNDSMAGALEMKVRPDGNIAALVGVNSDEEIKVFVVDSAGNTKWSQPASHSGGIDIEHSYSFDVATDNSIYYIMDHVEGITNEFQEVRKLDATSGNIIWSKHLNSTLPQFGAFKVLDSGHNTAYIQYNNDSTVEVSDSGIYIRSRASFTNTIFALPDSNFLAYNGTQISLQDFAGNIQWSAQISGNVVAANNRYFYSTNSSDVTKVNTSNGNIIYSIHPHCGNLCPTSDDGFICVLKDPNSNIYNSSTIEKYDSNGVVEWSKNFSFPRQGFWNVNELRNKYYVTSGEWFYYTQTQQSSFAPFMATIDSVGNSILDSSSVFFPGNVNDNNYDGFVDDAPYVAAANGQTGPQRFPPLTNLLTSNVIGTSWADSFQIGYNFKRCDVDGNGLVNTADIRGLTHVSALGQYVEPEYRQASHTNSVLPVVSISIDQDTLTVNDVFTGQIILAADSVPIDSIYSIALVFDKGPSVNFHSDVPQIILGDSSSRILNFYASRFGNFLSEQFLACRKDRQNVFQHGDTLLKFSGQIDSLYFTGPFAPQSDVVYPFQLFSHAITNGGYTVDIQNVNDNIFLRLPAWLNTNELPGRKFNIYPNPSNDYINIRDFPEGELIITDNLGKIVFNNTINKNNYRLDVHSYNAGLYFLQVKTKSEIYYSRFTVVK